MGAINLPVIFSLVITAVTTSRPSQFPGAGPEGELQTAIRTGYTCEGEELFIQCEKEETIQIVRANYGRFSIAICNEEGKTHWSVNCMSPKTRHILQNRCDRLNSCSVPVSSDLFGDPCPGTHKYVEIHYTCSPKTDTTRRPLPPWYLQQPSLQSGSQNQAWLSHSAPTSHTEDQAADPASSYNSRIPILVATTTNTPKRVPITTPKPTTTSTTSTSTTTEESVTSDVYEEQEEEEEEIKVFVDESNEVMTELDEETEMEGEVSSSSPAPLANIPQSEMWRYCGATTARSLRWATTRAGEMVIQPCPNGATGLARWQCQANTHTSQATWLSTHPDLTDCKSVAMTNLEVKVRQEDPENVLASSLARLTGSRQLYGGDLQSAVAVMRTVASRVQYLLQQREDKFYKKEAFIQEVLLNIVRSASNLLEKKNREAWTDLEPAQQMKTASSLLLAMEENAFLFAEVTTKPEILMESSYNILMAISVLNVRDVRNGSSFPLNNYEEPYGTIEDSIYLPPSAIQGNSRDQLVKAVFFSFRQLEDILSQGDKRKAVRHSSFRYNSGPEQILNSRIISASLVGGSRQAGPVRVSLKHLREEGVGSPTCVFWDLETSVWSSAGCRVLNTNSSRTVCQCQQRANFALLMEEQNAPIVIQLPAFHVEIIVGAVMAVLVLVTVLALFKFREQVHKFVLKSPCFKEEKKGLETCHKSQSFFNGINLMPSVTPSAGGDKSQTMSTAVTDNSQRLSQFVFPEGGVEDSLVLQSERYENIEGLQCGDQATLPMRSRMSPHITLNPYSTQLVDNINRMMAGGHIYQVAQLSPQLSQLTNTLKKKKCVGGHSGPCLHSDTSVTDTESDILASSDVVFRAVSPHGHVYWEIDPKRPNKLMGGPSQASETPSDTNNDLHNMSDFSEEDHRAAASDRSRQSSSRFSDSRPLINSSPCHIMSPLPESLTSLTSSHTRLTSPAARFNSLQKVGGQQVPITTNPGFSTRTRLARPGPSQRLRSEERLQEPGQSLDWRRSEQVQQQVQIPDLRRIPVSVASSEYIMAKIQTHMADHRADLRASDKRQKQPHRHYSGKAEREV